MKKCPKCLKYDADDVRFCKHCGTELFFPKRFGDTPKTVTITVFHGSPRKGNTYNATKIFMDELSKYENVNFTEFFLPKDLPVFCTGCTLCLGGKREKCPNAQYVAPIFDAILKADAFIFATPHAVCRRA